MDQNFSPGNQGAFVQNTVNGFGTNLTPSTGANSVSPSNANSPVMGNFGNAGYSYGNYGVSQYYSSKYEYESKLKYDQLQCELIRIGNESFLRQQEMKFREELILKRKLATQEILLDSNGQLCRELLDADGKIIGVKPICRAEKVSSLLYTGKNKRRIKTMLLVLSSNVILFGLVDDRINSEELEKGFLKSHYPLQTSRDYKKNLSVQVLNYLVMNAREIIFPLQHGWNQIKDDKWIFSDYESSWEGVRDIYGLR